MLGLGNGDEVGGLSPAEPPSRPDQKSSSLISMTEEYVEVVRAVLAGEEHEGELFRTGRIALDRPPRAGMPIYLGALGPRMLSLAGRIADGVILDLMSPEQAGEAATAVRAAAHDAGRDPGSVQVLAVIHCCLSDDAALAAEAARAVVPRYALRPGADRLFGARLDEARGHARAGDHEAAARHVPQRVADRFVAHGDAVACSARVAEYRAAGIDLPVLFPMPVAGIWDLPLLINAFA
ncbi:LLM class flavin-dependent oxidoreductase [Spirillospora sp. NPDC048911]|uniref:LLM class flavin-dependent oxidoreductase n=1 Tax=Spirillospora sp. NPDC048911 TaxID=3364527 RepID=UPI00370FDF9C